jgi:hypothetical protein
VNTAGTDTLNPLSLPPLQAAVLDAATLQSLFEDLAAETSVDEILMKGEACGYASGGRPSLSGALEALEQGSAMGVQIRYRYQGSAWWDTLLRTPEGVRLVRIEHPAGPQHG